MKKEVMFKKIADDMVQLIRQQLTDNDNIASGELRDSTSYDILDNSINFKMNFYYKFVEEGTKPHMPPIAPIERWTKLKNINISSWAIAMKIKKFGTKKHPFLFILDTYDATPYINEYADGIAQKIYEKLKKSNDKNNR